MPPRGGPGGGGPRGGMGGMGGAPRRPVGGSMGGMGGAPRRPVGGMGGMRPPVRRGGSPLGGIISAVVVVVILLSALISSLSPVVWIALGVIVLVAVVLFYKYKSDRAKAEETQRILDTDLGSAGSSSTVSDLENKYK